MNTLEGLPQTLPPGYGVWLNDDGTWYVLRGYREHDGRTVRDGPMIRYQSRYSAARGAWRDYRRRGNQPGTAYPTHEA